MAAAESMWIAVLFFVTALSAEALPLQMKGSELPSMEQLKEILESSALLPVQSQRVVLKEMGDAFSVAAAAGDQCNVFTGKDSCFHVPEGENTYSRLCGSYSSNKTVDCAFKYEALGAIQRDPNENVVKEGYTGCEECSMAVKEFWCGQTLPDCGTTNNVVDEFLPFVTAVATNKVSALAALKDAVPRIFQAASLGLPCRKMCEAISNTCGCGRLHTFGEVMKMAEKGSKSSSFNVTISASTARELFIGVWHKPICHLFADENTPGFYGSCQHVSDTSKCDWCSKRKGRPSAVFYEQMAVQLSQMFYGIMQSGLHQVLRAAAGGKGNLQDNWSQSLSGSGEVSQARHTGVVFLLFLMLILAVGAFFAAVKAHRHRQVPSQYIDLNSLGYTPPML